MTGFLTHLEEEIKRLYAKLQISGPAYRDMQRIASEFHVWVHYEDTGSMMIKHQGLYSIILNRSLSSEEQWQDFAHELCHVLKHAGNHFKMHKLFRELQEFQAKQFMYHFCVPTFMLMQMKLPSLRQQAILHIAQTFHVTWAFAEKRLALFEQRKAGIRFQQEFTSYLMKAEKVAEKEAVYQT
ncbi:ImmA/IrrE family metallo-endopeptidase [Bacillus safensis]|uniref:ImmA/IrrE family metallo-endopeptidase n=1 Tax=Bacillus safensis TaxID=561879 RepID=UPI0018CCB2FF|nr:ImmA/IrrE family metallo-endopeptidase [Bacillus safensis]MBG9816726.1 phage portal protein [Bacillus safensis]WAT81981.1 ImmA/IrrE family metallo-endopeptidase [Bacillus safensis]